MTPLERVENVEPLITDQVKNMGGYGSDDELFAALPDNTLDRSNVEYTPTGRVKKPRKKKDVADDEDPRLKRFRAKSVGFGGATLVKAGFDVSGKPLDADEDQDLGDALYAISHKADIDVTNSYWFMVIYLMTLIGTFIASRTSLGQQVRDFFTKKNDDEEHDKDNDK